LDGPGIESRWGRYFYTHGAQQAYYRVGTGSFPRVKWAGRGVYHQIYLSPRLKKE